MSKRPRRAWSTPTRGSCHLWLCAGLHRAHLGLRAGHSPSHPPPEPPRGALPSHHGTLSAPPTHGLHEGPFRGTTGLRRWAPHTWPSSHGARHPRRPRERGSGLSGGPLSEAPETPRYIHTPCPDTRPSASAARPRVLAAPSPYPPESPCSLQQRPPVLRRLRPLPTARGPRRAPAPARSPTPSPADTPPIGLSRRGIEF